MILKRQATESVIDNIIRQGDMTTGKTASHLETGNQVTWLSNEM